MLKEMCPETHAEFVQGLYVRKAESIFGDLACGCINPILYIQEHTPFLSPEDPTMEERA